MSSFDFPRHFLTATDAPAAANPFSLDPPCFLVLSFLPPACLNRALHRGGGDRSCVSCYGVSPLIKKKYYLEVKELKPSNAVGIVETDLNVDFDAPVGYQEPSASASGGDSGGQGGGSSGATGAIGGSAMSMPAPASGESGGRPLTSPAPALAVRVYRKYRCVSILCVVWHY